MLAMEEIELGPFEVTTENVSELAALETVWGRTANFLVKKS